MDDTTSPGCVWLELKAAGSDLSQSPRFEKVSQSFTYYFLTESLNLCIKRLT